MRKELKKIHKGVVADLRRINKKIMNDEYLGLNRFDIEMFNILHCYKYSDNSGYHLDYIFKIKDNLTGNSAYFIANNYNYWQEIHTCANDFLIRCSSGHRGCIPSPQYIAYDIHDIAEYGNHKWNGKLEGDYILCTYDWTHYNLYR